MKTSVKELLIILLIAGIIGGENILPPQMTFISSTHDNGCNIIVYPHELFIIQEKPMTYFIGENISNSQYDLSHGFCVAKKDSENFLECILSYQGLNNKEIEYFKDYWLPVLKKSPYNIITFQQEVHLNNALSYVTYKPDTFIRLFITIQPSQNYVAIDQPVLPSYQREGFTVIELGGTVLLSH